MPEWAEKISTNDLVFHALRGATTGNIREAVHALLIEMAFQPYQIHKYATPPSKETLNRQLIKHKILIIIEATRRHDLGATIDVHIDEYIQHLQTNARKKILIIALIDKTHAHAYDHYHWGIINPRGPQQLYEQLQTYGVQIIFAEHDQIIEELRTRLSNLLVLSS